MNVMDLFKEMQQIQHELDQTFADFTVPRRFASPFLPGFGQQVYPQVNLSEDQDNLYVDALLPGVKKEDLELSVLRGTLTLSGERKEETVKDRTWHRRERSFGKFLRTIELSSEIDAEHVTAEYHNGVLRVTLPKIAAARPKKIDVSIH